MVLTSPAFKHNQFIPSKYTCDGENVSPPLSIEDIPAKTKSLVLIVDDPDAPGKTFTHWTVWNIDPRNKGILEGVVPENAVQGMTDFGNNKYGGPCPPGGTHRYFFKLYALNSSVELDESGTKEALEKEIGSKIIDDTELIGLYKRTY